MVALVLGALIMALQPTLGHFWQLTPGGPKSPPPAFVGGTEGSLGRSVPGGSERHSPTPGTHESTEPRPDRQVLPQALALRESRGGPPRGNGKGTFKLWTFNVNSLHKGRLHEILKVAQLHRVDAVALQGTRWKSCGTFRWEGWHISVGGATQVVDGVVTAVLSPATVVRTTSHMPGRLLETRWSHGTTPVVLLNGYAPTETRPEAERRDFWRALDCATAGVALRHHLVLAGDFNAHIGTDLANHWVGAVGGTSWNSNGEALYQLATRRQLRVLNTFGTPAATAPTWIKPGSNKGTRIDYIAVRGEHAKHAQKVGPLNIPALHASMGYIDHKPLGAQWHMPCLHRRGPRPVQHAVCDRLLMRAAYSAHEAHVDLIRRGHSLAPTQLAAQAETYNHAVAKALQGGIATDAALTQAATVHFPPKAQPRQHWIQHDTWQLIQVRQQRWRECRLFATLGSAAAQGTSLYFKAWRVRAQWQRAHRRTRQAIARDKRDSLGAMAESAQKAAERGDQRTLYQMVRAMMPKPMRQHEGLRKADGTLTANAREELATWDTFMAETFGATTEPSEVATLPSASGTLVTEPDTLSALRKRKLGKATPKGTPCNEMVRLAEQALTPHLTTEWNAIAQFGTMPEHWRNTELVWIPKPGGTSNNPQRMRGIHLLHPLAAGYCTAIQRKLKRAWRRLWTPAEHGALPHRSTRDPLILVNSLILRARKAKRSFTCFFGDLRKAFDLIHRDRILNGIADLLPEGTLRRATQDRHLALRTTIHCEDLCSRYTLPHGVAQGDSLGPICFVGTYHQFCGALDAHRPAATLRGLTGRVQLPGGVHRVPMHRALFVDDHFEFWLTPTEAAALPPLQHMVHAQGPWGLRLNWDKVQILMQPMGTGSKRLFPNKGQLRYEGKLIGGPHHAKYLGALLTKTGTHGPEVQARLAKAVATLVRLGKHVWGHVGTLQLKVRLYEALVRSVLLYGMECWGLTKGQLRQLEQFQNRALRWIVRSPAHISHESNEALRRRLGVCTVESQLRVMRLKWLRAALNAPEHHLQPLCALFGTLPWDDSPPTIHDLPLLALIHDDVAACRGSCEVDERGALTVETLAAVQQLTVSDIEALRTYDSTVERGTTRQYGPPNEPKLQCTLCDKAFDTEQRMALHMFAAHKVKNTWRALIVEPKCPFCHSHFATLETARRHVVKNVCGLRQAPIPPVNPGNPPAPASQGQDLRRWAQCNRGHAM